MTNKTKICLFFGILLGLMLIPCVYAQDDEAVNLSDFPKQLAEKLTIPLFAGQILATGIVIALFCFVPILAKNLLGTILFGFVGMGLCVALAWLPYWFLFVLGLLVALLFAGNMRQWITGGAS